MRLMLFWAIVGTVLPFALFRPFSGIAFYFFFTHIGLVELVWFGGYRDYGKFLIAATTVGYVMFAVRRSPIPWRRLWVLFAFWFWIGVTSWRAFFPADAWPSFWQYSRMFVVVVLAAALANSANRVRWLLLAVGGAFGLLAVRGMFVLALTGGADTLIGPPGMLAGENEFAAALVMSIPILVLLAGAETKARNRRVLRFLAFCSAVAVVGTRSRGGLLGLIGVTLLLVWRSRRKTLALTMVAVAAVLFFVLTPDATMARYRTIEDAQEKDLSAIGRLEAWETATRMAQAHPLFGVGPRNFILTFNSFTDYQPRAPHNAWFALIAEMGIPGVVLFTLLLVLGIREMGWLGKELGKIPGQERLAACCLALQGAYIGFILPNVFINGQFFDILYHLYGAGIGAGLLGRRVLAEAKLTSGSVQPASMQPTGEGADATVG